MPPPALRSTHNPRARIRLFVSRRCGRHPASPAGQIRRSFSNLHIVRLSILRILSEIVAWKVRHLRILGATVRDRTGGLERTGNRAPRGSDEAEGARRGLSDVFRRYIAAIECKDFLGAKKLRNRHKVLDVDRMYQAYKTSMDSIRWKLLSTHVGPGCNTRAVKEEGCNHVQCTLCWTHFCFACGDKLPEDDPYAHFGDEGGCLGREKIECGGTKELSPELQQHFKDEGANVLRDVLAIVNLDHVGSRKPEEAFGAPQKHLVVKEPKNGPDERGGGNEMVKAWLQGNRNRGGMCA